jgi:hypothetical protein
MEWTNLDITGSERRYGQREYPFLKSDCFQTRHYVLVSSVAFLIASSAFEISSLSPSPALLASCLKCELHRAVQAGEAYQLGLQAGNCVRDPLLKRWNHGFSLVEGARLDGSAAGSRQASHRPLV